MPLRPEDQKRVDELTAAAAHLRTTGAPQLADTVDFVLTPDGRSFINRLRVERLHQQEAEGAFDPNFAMQMPRPVRDEVKATAKALGGDLAVEARTALEQFLAGEFTPVRPKRATRNTFEDKVNLNIRVNKELRERADAHGKELAGTLGWEPRASHVIVNWLVRKFTEAGK